MTRTTMFTAALIAMVSGSAVAHACTPQDRSHCARMNLRCLAAGTAPRICELQEDACLGNAGCKVR